VVEKLFRLLFKYPPLMFQQADFTWGLSRPLLLVVGVGAALAAGALFTYRGLSTIDRVRDRVVLIALRVAALVVLFFCLVRPTLVLKAAVPQQNFLGVLVDDSRSMAIADRDGQARSAFVQEQLGAANAKLLSALSQRFVVRFFSFSSSSDRVPSASALKFAGTSTRLGQALDRARDELAGLPLAGLVMVTDGADTSDTAIDESLASLKARSIPVFTVGVGQERFARDVQVTRVETPRAVLKGTALVVDVVLSQTGYGGQTVPLSIEDDGRIVSTQDVKLPPEGESATVKVRFTANEAGARVFTFKIPTQNGEQVTQNNARDALIQVNDRAEKVLYYEGEPRVELKFLRRAVEEDKNLQVVSIDRTAENKYYRQGVSTPDELIGGFPKTREELFQYRALILGSVEAASFTPEQLRMIADFVSKRGGSLLMLGGRRSFAEGGWGGTPVSEVLPVVMGSGNSKYYADIAVRPTRAGALTPVTQIGATDDASASKWNDMPELSAVNLIREVKPGATVLLTGTDHARQDHVVLAFQRFGRGKAFAMPVQDTWLWRMDAKMAVTDTTHAMFWRRLIRWLVDGVPGQVNVTTTADRVEPGEPVKLTAEVLDPAYAEVNDGRVVAHVTSPSGKTNDVPLDWTVTRDGDYRASFVPEESGIYTIRVDAERPDQKQLGASSMHVRVSAGDAEYFDAAMRAPLLKRIAEDTGGRFFTPANVASLPEAISYSGRGVTVVEERELWDMPALFVTLVGLVGAEWGYRRVKGLA
jgi:uncharacterized membrane protein